jgi:predicted glycoside hydrolase/deacetylase ChbG (UPF0249 family)
MKQLIVNADDYGLTTSVCAGIQKAHREGIVTSTTAMMNMAGVEVEVQTALESCPRLGLGVHLVLTSGRPISTPSKIPSLIRICDSGQFPSRIGLIENVNKVNVEDIKVEWQAQVEHFIQVTGRTPDHLDSHHHISYLSPELFRTMLELAGKYNCAIRNPVRDMSTPGKLFEDIKEPWLEKASHAIFILLQNSRGIRRPDHFEDQFYDQGAGAVYLEKIITSLPEGVTELMCHPSLPDEQLKSVTIYYNQRPVELALLTDPRNRNLLCANGVELITFGDLRLAP